MQQLTSLGERLVDHAADLRRKRQADLTTILQHRARYAGRDDAALIDAIYGRGLTASEVARLRDEHPRTTRRRVRQVVARLLSDRYREVLRARDQWPPGRRAVADSCVLQGRSMRETAKCLGRSFHAVRREMDIINALTVHGRKLTH